jgi:hypothetical protein
VIADGLGLCFTDDLLEELRAAEPELPDELSDRAQDVWEPLLAIADVAGGDRPARGRKAAVKLSGPREPDEATLGVRLLADIRDVFGGEGQLTTQELRQRLREVEEAPWGGWNDGEGIMPRELANKLRPYGVRSHDLRTDEGTRKGYRRGDFEDAWSRYLPVSPGSKRDKRDIGSTEPETAPSQARQDPHPSRIEDGDKPLWNADVADVADIEGDRRPRTFEDVLLDSDGAEQLRAGVNGEWGDPSQPLPDNATVWDYRKPGCTSHRGAPQPGCRYCKEAS